MKKSYWKSDEWYVDKYGQLKLREAYDDEIEMQTLVPVFSEEQEEFIFVDSKA
ncbi:MAG: hypothetical protein ACP5OA_02350 [Candidatus Woesearchaeota archaeon]